MSQHIFRLLFLILLVSIFETNILPQNKPNRWLYVVMSVDGYKYYRQEKIDRLENGNPAYWVKALDATGIYRKTYYEWDCDYNRLRILQDFYYLPNDKLLENKNQPTDTSWIFAPPDSMGEVLFAIACKPLPVEKIVEISANRANLRSNPHPEASIVKTAEKGARFQLSLGKVVGQWFNVVDEETQEDFWIHRSVFEFIK